MHCIEMLCISDGPKCNSKLSVLYESSFHMVGCSLFNKEVSLGQPFENPSIRQYDAIPAADLCHYIDIKPPGNVWLQTNLKTATSNLLQTDCMQCRR